MKRGRFWRPFFVEKIYSNQIFWFYFQTFTNIPECTYGYVFSFFGNSYQVRFFYGCPIGQSLKRQTLFLTDFIDSLTYLSKEFFFIGHESNNGGYIL